MTELPMSTRKGPFVAVVVIVLFVFISCALLEKSDQHFSRKGSKKCLRNCLRRQEHLNATRLSSCYHNCLKKKNRGAAQHLGLYSKIIHQRTRKALPIPHNDGCPDPSPSQTVDWSPQQKNVSFGKYENASHWYVNVSWTPMNDTQGSWNAIKVSLIVQSSLDSWWDDVNCSVHPKNQTFLQLNLSLYHYQYPNSIFVTIVALPYTNYYSPPLRPFTPPIPSTSRPTSRPTTASTSRPTSHSTTASTSRPTSRPTTASTSRPTSRPTTASTSPPTSRPTTASACSRREYSDLLWYPEEVDVHFSQRETKDWYANISWTPLADPTVSWKGYLVTIFSRKLQCFKVPKNQTFVIVDSSDVWEYPDELYLNVTAFPSQKRKQEDLTTFYPPVPPLSESASPPTSRPTTASASPPNSRPTTVSTSRSSSRPTTAVVKIVAISFGAFVGLALSLWIIVRCRRKPKIDRPEDFQYAAFIVFSFSDAKLMEKVLYFLETELQLKCCVHFRDFAPGKPFVENMAYSVNNSYKVVILFSNNFLTSEFAEFEMKLAIHRMVERRDNSLVVIRIDDVDPARLPSELITKSFIDYNSYLERPFWKQRILELFNSNTPSDDQTICYEHTDRPPYTRLCSTLSTESQMSYV
ncbi:PREDICTED: uncharacterized protein LOC107353721 isoform X16 [Acropora digitifera]|uniref:uncharacterized protein LOC107353721 isoform X16 n=1 Tax=Acropora digitifera TaxID=70779 RepID=UPI00077ADF92|nr:PREDICTED: uncharacterized protein LOC107353721 isoform X16 [Acropora digitifera]